MDKARKTGLGGTINAGKRPGPARNLLRQAEPHLHPEPRSGTPVGIRNLRVVNGPLEVGLDIELLVYHVADVWSQLDVDAAVGDHIQLVHLPLNGPRIRHSSVQSERNVVLQYDEPAFGFER